MGFENAPFKLTAEYVELMGGPESPMFAYFKVLLIQGFVALKKYVDSFEDIVEIMSRESKLPCFEKFDINVFLSRFKKNITDREVSRLLTNTQFYHIP